MVWFRVDDVLPFHARVIEAGNAATGLWVRAGAWCAWKGTPVITWSALPGSPEVHELIPVAQGGSPYDPANCMLTHRTCNQWIGNRIPQQLAQAQRPGHSPSRPAPPPPVTTSRRW